MLNNFKVKILKKFLNYFKFVLRFEKCLHNFFDINRTNSFWDNTAQNLTCEQRLHLTQNGGTVVSDVQFACTWYKYQYLYSSATIRITWRGWTVLQAKVPHNLILFEILHWTRAPRRIRKINSNNKKEITTTTQHINTRQPAV